TIEGLIGLSAYRLSLWLCKHDSIGAKGGSSAQDFLLQAPETESAVVDPEFREVAMGSHRSLSQYGDLLRRPLGRKGVVGEQDGIHARACGEEQAEAGDDRTSHQAPFPATGLAYLKSPSFIGGAAGCSKVEQLAGSSPSD